MSLFIQSALRTLHNRKRRCPACGRVQYVALDQADKTVSCHACKRLIPPQRRPIGRHHPPYTTR